MATHSNRGQLIVDPGSQVRFPGPPLRPSRAIIKLINNTTKRIAYKIKTTAPSFYGVRPNGGVVSPYTTAEVEIARQPFTHEQAQKINHKFMVQSIVVPDDVDDVSRLWQDVEPDQLGIVKLRCVFLDSPNATSSKQPMAAAQTPSAGSSTHSKNAIEPSSSPKRQISPYKLQPATMDRSVDAMPGSGAVKKKAEPTKMDRSVDAMPGSTKRKSLQNGGGIKAEPTTMDRSIDAMPGSSKVKPKPSEDEEFKKKKPKLSESKESLRRILEGQRSKENAQTVASTDAPKPMQLDAQTSTRSSLNGQPPQNANINYLNYNSNTSASVASRNQFSPKNSLLPLTTPQRSQNLSPSKLASPQRSQNIGSPNGKGMQMPRRDSRQQQLQKPEEIFTQLQIATMNTEIHQLRTENKYLHKENQMLQEEVQHRHRHLPSPVRGEYTIPHTELQQPQRPLPISYVVASMTFALLCIMIGKFLL